MEEILIMIKRYIKIPFYFLVFIPIIAPNIEVNINIAYIIITFKLNEELKINFNIVINTKYIKENFIPSIYPFFLTSLPNIILDINNDNIGIIILITDIGILIK